MAPRPQLSVDEAAQRLGLSSQRIRALIAAGRLPAERVGARYLLDPAAVAEVGRLKRPGGRPLSARNVWAVLAELGGHPEAAAASRRSAFRVRRLLGEGPDTIVRSLVHAQPHADEHAWRVLPSDLEKLQADPRLVATGLAADDPLIDVRYLPARDGFDAYISSADLTSLQRRFRPQLDSAAPNVVLRVPLVNSWILDQRPAPSAVVAADLLNDRDPRVRRAARAALERVIRGD